MSSFVIEYRKHELLQVLKPSISEVVGSGTSQRDSKVTFIRGVKETENGFQGKANIDPTLIQTRVKFKSNKRRDNILAKSSRMRNVQSEPNLVDYEYETDQEEAGESGNEFSASEVDELSDEFSQRNRARTISRASLEEESSQLDSSEPLAETKITVPESQNVPTGKQIGDIAIPSNPTDETTSKEIEIKTDDDFPVEDGFLGGRTIAGSSMRRGTEQEWVRCSWNEADPSCFSVRSGPNYSRLRNKEPSKKPLYRTVACDVLRNSYDEKTKLHNIASREELIMPNLEGIDLALLEKSPLPGLIVCNCQIPRKPPKMMGRPEPDTGISLVFYYQISNETLKQSLDLSSASAAVQLLVKYVKEASGNQDIRRRMKLIGKIKNMNEIGLPSMVKGYNGKPVIINKSGELFFGKTSTSKKYSYMEMDILVHSFNYLAKKGLYGLKDSIPKMSLQLGFLIQGEEDEELPECLFGCTSLYHLDYEHAQSVNLPPVQWVSC